MKKKPGRKPNLQAMIRDKALHSRPPSDADIQAMLVAMLYDTPDDVGDYAHKTNAKIKCLQLLHQINQDNTKPDNGGDDLDSQVLRLLAERAERRRTRDAQQAQDTDPDA